MNTRDITRDVSSDITRNICFDDSLRPNWSVDLTQALDASLSLTRASGATAFDASGNLVTVGSNAPRIDFNPTSHAALGLLVEEQRTNYLLNSTAPATQTVTLGTGTYTVWLNGTGSCAVAAGTAVGSGFGSVTTSQMVVFTLTTAGTVVFTVSGSVVRFQCEKGSYATSLIVTTTAATTRAADVCVNTSMPWFNTSEGTFVVEATTAQSVGTGYPIFASTGSTTTALSIMLTPSGSSGLSRVGNVNVGIANVTTVPTPKVAFRQAFAYRQDDFALCQNGGTIATDTSGALPGVLTQINVGGRISVDFLNGWVRTIKYYNKRLSNAQLVQMTL